MNEKFNSLVNKYSEDTNALKADQEKYLKKIQTFHPFVVAIYPAEVESFFKEINLDKEIKQWSGAKEMVKSIDSFNIDYHKKTITVTLGEESFSNDLVNVKDYALGTLKLTTDSWQYNLILSFFSDPQNFEMFQLTQAIKAE